MPATHAAGHDAQLGDRAVLTSGVQIADYVVVEPDCEIGQGATIRQRIRIGHGSLVGMGAVVVRDVPPDTVMVGKPARRLRARSEGKP